MNDWKWAGKPAHFVGSDDCKWHLTTHVGGYIVSSIGEYRPAHTDEMVPLDEFLTPLYYETFVFVAESESWEIGEELEGQRYSTADKATEGHMHYCHKWSKIH